MCGRYKLTNKNEIKKLYDVNIDDNYNISPGSSVLVLADGPRIMKWSYSPKWAKTPFNIYNARSETLYEKPSFAESKRCVYITDGWYEWKRWFDWERRENKKVPYLHTINDNIFYIGGIYNESGCAIVTSEAKGELSNIHDRQPVLLSENDIGSWLNGNDVFDNLLNRDVNIKEVSNHVNSTRNNGIKCIKKD